MIQTSEILDNCKDEDERRRTENIIKPILRGRDIKRYYEMGWAMVILFLGIFHYIMINLSNMKKKRIQKQYSLQDK